MKSIFCKNYLVKNLSIKNNLRLLFLLSIYLFFVSGSVFKPFMWDELTFVRMGTSLSQGNTKVYLDEYTSDISPWYPTSYFMVITAFIRLFGETEFGLRLIGVICLISSIIILFRFASEYFKNNSALESIPFIICIFYILNPFVVQGSTLIEIDTSILNVLILLFNVLVFKYYEKGGLFFLMMVGVLLGLIILAKFVTAFFILLAFLVFMFLREDFITAIKMNFIVTFLSLITFISGWFLYCKLTGVPTLYPFEFISGRAEHMNMFSLEALKNSFVGFLRKLLWLSPSYFVLLIISSVLFIRRTFKDNHFELLTLFWMEIVFAFLFYIWFGIDAAGYPKYLFSLYSISLFLIINEFIYLLKHDSIVINYKSAFSVLLLTLYFYVFVGDPILSTIQYKFSRFVPDKVGNLKSIFVLKLMFWMIPLIGIAIYAILGKLSRSKNILQRILASLFIVFISSNSAILLKQRWSDYSLLYMYGMKTESVYQTAAFTRKLIEPNEICFLPAEVAFYLGMNYRYYDIDMLFYKREFISKVSTVIPKIIVLRDHNYGNIDNVNDLNNDIYKDTLKKYRYEYKYINGYSVFFRSNG